MKKFALIRSLLIIFSGGNDNELLPAALTRTSLSLFMMHRLGYLSLLGAAPASEGGLGNGKLLSRSLTSQATMLYYVYLILHHMLELLVFPAKYVMTNDECSDVIGHSSIKPQSVSFRFLVFACQCAPMHEVGIIYVKALSMAKTDQLLILLIRMLLVLMILIPVSSEEEETKNFYIVYLGDGPSSKGVAVRKHLSLLSSVKASEHDAKESMVYSYTKSFNAFAAKLSRDEAQMLEGCADMDILAAMDDAASDGVDVISISIGGVTGDFVTDSISVGAFHALKKGIITVASGGNDGPSLGSVSNYAPWLLTVAATGIDRQFRSAVKLGNGKSFSGIGINTFGSNEKFYPIVSGADAAINAESKELARFCYDNTLDPAKVKGRLVYCLLGEFGADSVVKETGGVGIVLESEQNLDTAQIYMAPATMVNMTVGEIVDKYIHSTRSPSAVIYKSHEVKVSAPFVASFSSRGPNAGSQHVLKA
ncbi:hypothetical protein V6N12_059413 [Hibiscus sabdariffa]|uniref:Inhibitor I9 domain-containing protein n=1 Tax=Hibiscus sabdariffa TaxID=183260 RepID=A0ABR2EV26_9ROSI